MKQQIPFTWVVNVFTVNCLLSFLDQPARVQRWQKDILGYVLFTSMPFWKSLPFLVASVF